ncbi:Ubiquinone/menaquinone biosynthesis C-methyltransferase UbiE [Clarias magur]|uniref:Ubiquinone/menaquinone biosynthesis C-methyltransferase UbiE n=1 Tax=Clarias magur TaxID=1594786 RepID=A0A8J4XHI6_CLAMG|nr:Ubiquinone/menaquinone biosynthesis C-methyltransferase UbiE [Clarias magur]
MAGLERANCDPRVGKCAARDDRTYRPRAEVPLARLTSEGRVEVQPQHRAQTALRRAYNRWSTVALYL